MVLRIVDELVAGLGNRLLNLAIAIRLLQHFRADYIYEQVCAGPEVGGLLFDHLELDGLSRSDADPDFSVSFVGPAMLRSDIPAFLLEGYEPVNPHLFDHARALRAVRPHVDRVPCEVALHIRSTDVRSDVFGALELAAEFDEVLVVADCAAARDRAVGILAGRGVECFVTPVSYRGDSFRHTSLRDALVDWWSLAGAGTVISNIYSTFSYTAAAAGGAIYRSCP